MLTHGEDRQKLSRDLFCMRGMGIGLVIVVHVLGVDAQHGVRKLFPADRADLQSAFEFIHSFNMAVMVMGSGVALAVFGRGDRPWNAMLAKKVSTLLVPLSLWAPLLLLAQTLSVGWPREAEVWRDVLRQLPGAWSPEATIFWFVHVLFWCSLAGWLFSRLAAPSPWHRGVYFVGALAAHGAVLLWKDRMSPDVGEYVALLTYWNRFFALGVLVQPGLPAVGRVLLRCSVAWHVLLGLGLLGLLGGIHALLAREHYDWTCTLNGPLGFCLVFCLAVLLRRLGSRREPWRGLWRGVCFVGSISMQFYLFHLYFVSGARVLWERVMPGAPLASHLVLGALAGGVGPWLLFSLLKTWPLFRWGVGLPPLPPSRPSMQDAPRSGEAPAVSSSVG